MLCEKSGVKFSWYTIKKIETREKREHEAKLQDCWLKWQSIGNALHKLRLVTFVISRSIRTTFSMFDPPVSLSSWVSGLNAEYKKKQDKITKPLSHEQRFNGKATLKVALKSATYNNTHQTGDNNHHQPHPQVSRLLTTAIRIRRHDNCCHSNNKVPKKRLNDFVRRLLLALVDEDGKAAVYDVRVMMLLLCSERMRPHFTVHWFTMAWDCRLAACKTIQSKHSLQYLERSPIHFLSK